MTAPQARLNELQANETWATKLMQGDAAIKSEFNALSAKALGFDVPSSPADSAQARLDRMTSDPGFADKYFNGNPAAVAAFNEAGWAERRELTLMSIISSNAA